MIALAATAFLLSLIISPLFAAPITVAQARVAAEKFAVLRYHATGQTTAGTVSQSGGPSLSVRQVEPLLDSDRTIGFVANLAPSGYVLLSADDQAPPIKLHSDQGAFTNLPPGFLKVIQTELAEDLEVLAEMSKQNIRPASTYQAQWATLTETNDASTTSEPDPVSSPGAGTVLLTTTWNQNDPYNYYCPAAYGGPGGRAWAGCTACAVSQILRYRSRPSVGAMRSYDWANMPNAIRTSSPVAQQQAIGHLMYDAAVALGSTFGADETSAYPTAVPGVLVTDFNYTYRSFEYKANNTDLQWYNKIAADINANKPVFYAMWESGNVNGHAVVCDGYYGGNEIHLNLGWSGSGTLWYNIDSVDYGGYTWVIHDAVFGITPPAAPTALNITKMQVKLNFAKTNSDSCTLTGTLNLGTGYTPASATVNIGGANIPFTLDSKGKGTNSYGSCTLACNKKTSLWTLTVKLAKGSWQTPWALHGLVNDDVPKTPVRSVTMPVTMVVGTDTFTGTCVMVYTAQRGKSGSAK
ncbi:MAG: C10 family peptidase [Verrucomicrobiia bacterium]